jgi:membrane fusion protein, heavy metal efflux system
MIKSIPFAFVLFAGVLAAQTEPDANTVILTEEGVRNLRLETVAADPTTFEETFFALGRIEALPEKTASVASRISGRVVELSVIPGDQVRQGQEIVRVESRQPGNPPPTVPIAAPLAGMVTTLDARLGDPVEPDRPLIEIIDLSEVLAVARVPEANASKIEVGTKAHIRVTALGDTVFDGELMRFGTKADAASGTLDAIFRLLNPEGRIRPGMRAEFSIITERRENIVAVPRTAIQGDPANRFVYVKHFDLPNTFVKTAVVVGQMNDQQAEIVSGLFPADEVVTRGAYSLAFAGGGSLSLKDALDAAHGHEHNADGSEMTADQKKGGETDDGHDHDHGPGGDHDEEGAAATGGKFWMIVSAVLLVLLIVVSAMKRRPSPSTGQ